MSLPAQPERCRGAVRACGCEKKLKTLHLVVVEHGTLSCYDFRVPLTWHGARGDGLRYGATRATFLIVLLLGGAKGGVGRWLHHLTHGELRSDGGGEQRRVDGKAGLDVVAKPRLKRGKL